MAKRRPSIDSTGPEVNRFYGRRNSVSYGDPAHVVIHSTRPPSRATTPVQGVRPPSRSAQNELTSNTRLGPPQRRASITSSKPPTFMAVRYGSKDRLSAMADGQAGLPQTAQSTKVPALVCLTDLT